jgi:hypothetical protein
LSDADLQRIDLKDNVIGPIQEAYADGVDTLYVEKLNALIRSEPATGPGSAVGSSPGALYSGSPTMLGSDPVAALRKALAEGHLRDEGPAEVDGRAVRLLVDEQGLFEYAVDAETFEPVRARMLGRWGEANSPHPLETMANDVHFKTFEVMPLDEETDDLLEIDTAPSPTVVETESPPANAPTASSQGD